MKRILFLAAAAVLALPALAGPADDLMGTWECRIPGAAPTRTPPIVWFGPAPAEEAAASPAVDLDGFARTVSGVSGVVPEADGWLKVQPKDGEAFQVQPLPPRGKTPAMTLKRGNASYHCLRLPLYS